MKNYNNYSSKFILLISIIFLLFIFFYVSKLLYIVIIFSFVILKMMNNIGKSNKSEDEIMKRDLEQNDLDKSKILADIEYFYQVQPDSLFFGDLDMIINHAELSNITEPINFFNFIAALKKTRENGYILIKKDE